MTEDTVTITEEEYRKFVWCERAYDKLVAYGVDNWDGHELAMAELQEELNNE